MQITEQYKRQLDLVRQNPALLENYRFESPQLSNHYERLRLNIAMYNDLQPSDFEIAKFLFTEESKWRIDSENGKVDNLYFSAFIVMLFKRPEMMWLFYETKNIDFDSGIGFDGEYLVAAGIEKTYAYLANTKHNDRQELLDYIGETADTCNYTDTDIEQWIDFKKQYFSCYTYPVTDDVYFYYSTNERELFLAKLPEWIDKPRKWTREDISLFKTYAAYTEDKLLQVRAAELDVEKNDKAFFDDINKKELAGTYIEVNEHEKAFNLLQAIINSSDNKNTIRDCVGLLCKIIIANGENVPGVSAKAFVFIQKQQHWYGQFSPYVDGLINDATLIMQNAGIDADAGINQPGCLGFIRRWFGFK